MKLALSTAIVMTMAAPAATRPIIVVIDQPSMCSRFYEAEMAKAQKVVNDTIGAERQRAEAEGRKPREVRVTYTTDRPHAGTYGGDVRTQPGAPIRTNGC